MRRENRYILMKLVSTGCALVVAGGCHSGAGEEADAPRPAYDTLIQNSRIVDGTGHGQVLESSNYGREWLRRRASGAGDARAAPA